MRPEHKMGWVALAVIAVDQGTKLGYDGPVNAGLAFSTGGGTQSWVQVVLGVVFTYMFLAWAIRTQRPWWATALAYGGLLSNIYDRVVYGGARDPFFYGIHWNLADVAIVLGLAICAVDYLSSRREEVNAP